MRTVAEAVKATAEYIDEHGFIQGTWTDGRAVCLVGGIGAVTLGGTVQPASRNVDTALYFDTRQALRDYLNCPPMRWSDAPGRTKTEVIDMLRRFAEELERNAS